MNELEMMVSTAMRERAGEVTVSRLRCNSYPVPVPRRSSRWIATGAAAAVVALLAIAIAIIRAHHSGSSARASSSPAAGIVGFQWNVTAISHNNVTYRYTAGERSAVFLIFRPSGQIEGSDGVNYYSGTMFISAKDRRNDGRYELTSTGYAIRGSVPATLAAYGGTDPRVLTSQRAIAAALQSGREYDARQTNGTLTINADGYRLTLVQGSPVRSVPTPSPTTSR